MTKEKSLKPSRLFSPFPQICYKLHLVFYLHVMICAFCFCIMLELSFLIEIFLHHHISNKLTIIWCHEFLTFFIYVWFVIKNVTEHLPMQKQESWFVGKIPVANELFIVFVGLLFRIHHMIHTRWVWQSVPALGKKILLKQNRSNNLSLWEFYLNSTWVGESAWDRELDKGRQKQLPSSIASDFFYLLIS